jgi:hypothetical protein
MSYQPKTGPCHCKPGTHRDNCPDCEGTGQRIDFIAVRALNHRNTPDINSADAWRLAEVLYRAGDRSWLPITESFWWESLEVMPPLYVGRWFAVSEPWRHTPTGQPVYLFFRERPIHACRYATAQEIQAEQTPTSPELSKLPTTP